VWLGFVMYKIDPIDSCKTFKKHWNFLGWFLSLGFIAFFVYVRPQTSSFNLIYDTVARFFWASSICWIIFACHHLKTGWIIRKLLSHRFWQPLSRLSLSIYLIHYVYINYNETYQFQPEQGFKLHRIVHISAGDITMSIFFATLFHLFVEAPIANLTALIWNRKQEKSLKDLKIHSSESEFLINKA
jgi:peptidoglycan/LPS O-acetylase OafA/YrhL